MEKVRKIRVHSMGIPMSKQDIENTIERFGSEMMASESQARIAELKNKLYYLRRALKSFK